MPIDFKPIPGDPELVKLGIHVDTNKGHFDYEKLSHDLSGYIRAKDEDSYLRLIRDIAKQDFFFLCYFVLDLPINHPYLFARVLDIQEKNHLTMDLWFRESWKSTLLTYALPIWEIINNKEERICIFSHTRALAKSHMLKIKTVLEKNLILLSAFEDIFYMKPEQQAPKWSLDEGLHVKRKQIYNEASFESWGLVDSQPTGKHFSIMVFDDIIDLRAVSTADQIIKATTAYKMALNLGTRRGKRRIIGTRYSHKDTYSEIMKNHNWKVRLHPAEVDDEGKALRGGKPVYLTREELDEKFNEMGEWVYSSQMLQNPTAVSQQKFQVHWLKFWQKNKPYLNLYITVDPASSKKKNNDYTVMWVMGVDSLRNYWLVDGLRDRLDLGERWEKLRDLVLAWGIDTVGYEKYGMQADIDYINMKQEEEGCFFSVIELGGQVNKYDRIKRLQPLFQKGRIILPKSLVYEDVEGNYRDLVQEFIDEEYLAFPYTKNDDMLDAMARITDSAMGVTFPNKKIDVGEIDSRDDPLGLNDDSMGPGTWMGI